MGKGPKAMIEAVDLEKSFGAVQAVRGVSFTVSQGEAVGFLGPNGAGKTTTFRMLAGTVGPSRGTVRLKGKSLESDAIAAKRSIGYMAENPPLYPELTAREYLTYRAELKGITRDRRKDAIDRACSQARVQNLSGSRISHLSKGYRQRVALADALLGDPPILLLDEPMSGLDPNQVIETRKLIRELAQDRAIMLSTHVLSEVEATCSRAIVIHDGKIVAEGTLESLQTQRRGGEARIVVRAEPKKASAAIMSVLSSSAGWDGPVEAKLVSTKGDETTLTFALPSPGALGDVISTCVQAGIVVLEATPLRPALDEVFHRLTQSDDDGAG